MSKSQDPILEMYIFETLHLLEQLEDFVLKSEKDLNFDAQMDEIFRIMHTIKGNSAMMMYENIASLAHSIEDMFDYFRKNKDVIINFREVTDLILKSMDFIKEEVEKVKNDEEANGDSSSLINEIKESFAKHSEVIATVKGRIYEGLVFFQDGCQMENIRAYSLIHNLIEVSDDIKFIPKDIETNNESSDIIKNEGFKIIFKSENSYEEIKAVFNKTAFIEQVDLKEVIEEEKKEEKVDIKEEVKEEKKEEVKVVSAQKITPKANVLSVKVENLDALMDLVGELVVSESMVSKNPDLDGLKLENFNKAVRQLRKIINDLQDVVMSTRLVPLSITFRKMNRIVRDMNKNLNKEVELELIGEETEVDKNIIEHLSDPLMHLIRNSMDHGIEDETERIKCNKNPKGKITLEAKNAGGDVWVFIKDDGRGLDKDKIYDKAFNMGLTDKGKEELTEKEIFQFIMMAGFSTNEKVSEYSGRGVGMDVVSKNIETIRGTTYIESVKGKGTVISVKIPLTLAIIDGMIIRVGDSTYTIPTISIKESFKAKEKDLVRDPDGNEMIMVRGECYKVLRLHDAFDVETDVKELLDGIMVMVENGTKSLCLFVDALIGQQQVVIKTLPNYIKKVKGLAGCTLLGDGSISLILDITSINDL